MKDLKLTFETKDEGWRLGMLASMYPDPDWQPDMSKPKEVKVVNFLKECKRIGAGVDINVNKERVLLSANTSYLN